MAVGGFVDPSVRAVVVVVEAARRVVEQREVVLRLLLVAVVVVGGAVVVVVVVECVVASLSVRGTRSRPVTVAGRWSVVAVCSAPCSILSLSLSRPREDKARLVFRSVVQKWGHFHHHKGLVFPLFFLKSKKNNNRRKRKEVLIGQIVTHDTTHNNNNNRIRRGGRRL